MTLSTLSKSKEEDGVVRGLGEASDSAFAVPGVSPCFSFEAMKMRPAWKVQLPKGVKAACDNQNTLVVERTRLRVQIVLIVL